MSLIPRIFLKLTGLYLLLGGSLYAQQNRTSSSSACSITRDKVTLSWSRIANAAALKLPARKGNARLPRKYTVYTVDAGSLHTFLTAIKSKGAEPSPIVLPLGTEAGCETFNVGTSGTMSPGLAAKYPELASLKGQGVTAKSASVRLDYDGKEMNAEIVWNGIYYIISPWKKGSKNYYLVYKKEDSGMPRSVPAKGQYY
jgi:hypothetical protein